MKKLVTLVFLLVTALTTLCANNITVSNLSLTGKNLGSHYVMVKFDITWENSWRSLSGPSNWDAAWVFIKYRIPTDHGGDGLWKHAWLNNVDLIASSGISITDDQANMLEMRIFANEMVYVPQGAFTVGSGGTESGSFTNGSWANGGTVSLSISSESALTIGQSAGNLWGTSASGNNTIDGAGTLAAAFPKGYGGFYCMKYEISQQQYVDFLMRVGAFATASTPVSKPVPPGMASWK